MNLSKSIVKISLFVTFIVVLGIITIPTVYKVVRENKNKRALVNEKLIIEKAERCIYDGKCKTNTITLKTLYDNNYIKDKVVNPYDKTLYSEESYVVVTKEGSIFYQK